MWFFGNTKSFGFIFELVGFIMLFTACLYIVDAFCDIGVVTSETVTDRASYHLIIGVGEAIAALIYIYNAHQVMMGTVTNKVGVLSKYLTTVGITTIIGKCSVFIAEYLYDSQLVGMVGMVVAIIIGLIIILAGLKLGNGKKSKGKTVLRYILVIAFVLMAIWSFMPAESYIEFISNIAHLIIAIFMLIFLFDADVKIQLGGHDVQ